MNIFLHSDHLFSVFELFIYLIMAVCLLYIVAFKSEIRLNKGRTQDIAVNPSCKAASVTWTRDVRSWLKC